VPFCYFLNTRAISADAIIPDNFSTIFLNTVADNRIFGNATSRIIDLKLIELILKYVTIALNKASSVLIV
jgi:hypothetical protein